jgi:hypothetical protein
MPYNCEQIRDSLISGDPRLADGAILAHLENCPDCLRALELPAEISDEIENLNLLPAPFEIYDTVMSSLKSEKSDSKERSYIRITRIAVVSAAYLSLVAMIVFYWDAIFARGWKLLDGIIHSYDINLSYVSAWLSDGYNIANSLAQSPLLIAVILMSGTLVWAFALVKIRDTLKN